MLFVFLTGLFCIIVVVRLSLAPRINRMLRVYSARNASRGEAFSRAAQESFPDQGSQGFGS